MRLDFPVDQNRFAQLQMAHENKRRSQTDSISSQSSKIKFLIESNKIKMFYKIKLKLDNFSRLGNIGSLQKLVE